MGNQVKSAQDINEVIRCVKSGQITSKIDCSHLDLINEVTPSAKGCQDCLKTGDKWVHLRLCLICGYVGCCNDSKNKHASKHYGGTDHTLMMTYETYEDWLWCYKDEALILPLFKDE